MYEPDQAITVAIKPCPACGAALLEGSNFCRLCGVRQSTQLDFSLAADPPGAEVSRQAPRECFKTTRLPQATSYHPVSGPLVQAVAANLPASAPHSSAENLSKRMFLALMAIPIWLMIILMSPLDAYASAKIILSRV